MRRAILCALIEEYNSGTLKVEGFSEIAVIMASSPSKTKAGPDISPSNS